DDDIGIDIEHPINLVESETQVNFTSSNEDPTTTNIIRGHYTAKCRYCLKFWTRGIPDKLEAHLALKCEKVDRETSQIYLKKLAIKNSVSDIESEDKMSISTTNSRKSSNSKKRKINNNLHSYYENTDCNLEQKQKLDQALLCAFVVYGIPWNVISNPFFIDFVKLAKPGYDPATCKELSGQLLNQEIARITIKLNKLVKSERNMTL
ncbi:8676_t:CDS:2, partial [Entrophospora sp. SA101]